MPKPGELYYLDLQGDGDPADIEYQCIVTKVNTGLLKKNWINYDR